MYLHVFYSFSTSSKVMMVFGILEITSLVKIAVSYLLLFLMSFYFHKQDGIISFNIGFQMHTGLTRRQSLTDSTTKSDSSV